MSIVIAVCAAAGAVAGIAGSAAAPSKSSKSTQAQKKAARQKARALRHAFRAGGPGFLRAPVHAEVVVPNQDGTGFVTVTTDVGTLNEVDGTTVHLKQATDKATYKNDAAIDVGADAKVIRNREDAKLSDLKAGDHVRVIKGGPRGNLVIAEDDAFIQQEKKRWSKRGFRHRGFGGPPPIGPGGGPPPAGPDDPPAPNENGVYPGSPGGGSNS
jgi:type II secretory pathway pseudopilin PulG